MKRMRRSRPIEGNDQSSLGDEHPIPDNADAPIVIPAIEYILQRTATAIYCLARGILETLRPETAADIARWLEQTKGVVVSRNGPARFPGPDGTAYEWFFRVEGVSGAEADDGDKLYELAAKR